MNGYLQRNRRYRELDRRRAELAAKGRDPRRGATRKEAEEHRQVVAEMQDLSRSWEATGF